MRFDVITLFPEMFSVLSDLGVTGRAHQQNIWQLHTHNPRQFSKDVHNTVDDRPYGGGPGMVMMAEPLLKTLSLIKEQRQDGAKVVLLSPTGTPFEQQHAQQLADSDGCIFVCGRYEGIDQRFIDQCVDIEYSIGDFVLSGGELASLCIMDASVRLLPAVLNDQQSALQDSFHQNNSGLLDSPHYTRPANLDGATVPDVLLSGNHKNIELWRREQSLRISAQRRPDLIKKAREQGLLSKQDEKFLSTL